MSGGSYNYLYCKEVEDIIVNKEDLINIIDRLKELNCIRAFNYSQNILDDIRAVQEIIAEINNKINIISDLWRAVEFYDSNDIGINRVVDMYDLFCRYLNKK